jgi:hypothetical protein
MVLGFALTSLAANFRVQWSLSGATTYNLYSRAAGSLPSLLVGGLEAPASGDTMSYDVYGLADVPTRYFAVTAVSQGIESRLSNEMVVGPINPCAVDRCTTPVVCDFSPYPDGLVCDATAVDPCTGVCVGGTCGSAEVTTLAARRVVNNAARLRLAGTFSAPSLDPDASGVTLVLHDDLDATFYRVTVPGSALLANPHRTLFRFADGTGANGGLRRLKLRRGALRWSVSAFAVLAAPLEVFGAPLTWSLIVGSQCLRDADLECVSGGTHLSCR